jgi:hypothetical protein
LIVEGKVVLVGDKFWYNFPDEKEYPKDPKGWVRCTFSGVDGSGLIVKPQGFAKFVVGRNDAGRFSLVEGPRKVADF